MPYLTAREKAIQQYDAAFHLLNVTFPLVKDPKLLIGIINNLSQSFEHAMDSILAYEKQLRLVPNYSDNFQSKFNLFRYKCVRRNKIPIEHITLMMELKEILELQKKSPVEFQRGNRYILASKDYKLRALSINDIKAYLTQNKDFLEHLDRILRLK